MGMSGRTVPPVSAPAPDSAPTPDAASVPTPTATRRIYQLNVIAQTAIVVTGGLVRLTGSGLGCPTWPECTSGSLVPTATQEESWHKYIEFGNRTLTFVLSAVAIATLVAAILQNRRLVKGGRSSRPALIALAAAGLFGILAQALLGGITVRTGLNPATVAAHFLLSMALIAAAVVLLHRSEEPGDHPIVALVAPAIRIMSRVLVLVAALVVVLGTVVTGSGPHSGDAKSTVRFDIDPRTVSWLHADVVLLFIGLIVGMLVALHVSESPARARVRAWWLAAMALLQGLIGYTQYFTGVPWLLVALHILGACLIWIFVLRLHLSLRARGVAATTTD